MDVRRFETLTEAKAKEALYITIWLPQQYTRQIELAGNAESLFIQKLELEDFEFTGKLQKAEIREVTGHVELNSNEDMEIRCFFFGGRLDINQLSATSKLYVWEGMPFTSVVRGIGNHIFYEKSGVLCDDFSLKGDEAKECGNTFELNGMKSELIICSVSQES